MTMKTDIGVTVIRAIVHQAIRDRRSLQENERLAKRAEEEAKKFHQTAAEDKVRYQECMDWLSANTSDWEGQLDDWELNRLKYTAIVPEEDDRYDN